MSDISTRLARLRSRLASTADSEDRADLEAAIEALEEKLRGVTETTRDPAGDRIQVGDLTNATGVAVGAGAQATVYMDGRRADQAAQLLADYLHTLIGRCSALPLEALHQQTAHDDRYAIGLNAVYTQLTVEDSALREQLSGAALAQLDLQAFLRNHVGTDVLPWRRRTVAHVVYPVRSPAPADMGIGDEHIPGVGPLSGVQREVHLDSRSPDELRKIIGDAETVVFAGPGLLTDAIVEHRRLVLLGEPGSGKSTALRYLALTLAYGATHPEIDLSERLAGWETLGEEQHLLPLFVPLLPFARLLAKHSGMSGSADELWLHIIETLEPGNVRTGLAEAVHAELSAGRALLLFDGLDEVVGADSRAKVVRAVTLFAREHDRCRIVVSCRVRAYEGPQNAAWQLPGWPTATLQPWDNSQQRHFIGAWYSAAVDAGSLPEIQRKSRVETLRRAVAASRDLQRLAGSPLLLTVMALVHLNDGRLPEDRVMLYSRCIDILLAQWEQRGKESSDYGPLMRYIDLPDRDIQRLRPLLTRAAYVAHQARTADSPGSLGRETLRMMAMDHLAQLGHPNPYDGAQKLLEYTDHRAGLLQASSAGDAYIFPHLTFQEYLAGLELTSGLKVAERIMQHRRDERWQVPILLGVGDHVSGSKLEMPYQLLQKLLRTRGRSEDQRQRDLIFAAEIGSDVGWERLVHGEETFADLREELAEALAAVVEDVVLPATERVRAGALLGGLGDPREGVCTLPPAMVEFAGGSFGIGLTAAEIKRLPESEQNLFSDAENSYPVTVAPFALARYLVTNAQYALFIRADGYDPEAPWWEEPGRAWLRSERRRAPWRWGDQDFGRAGPNRPVVGVTWYEAAAFCSWMTQNREHNPEHLVYCLPSEAEWEYAARGMERRMYPWGQEEPDGERANFAHQYEGTTAVGCFSPGSTLTGLHDLAGNVWEWTKSVYRQYLNHPDDDCEDGTAPSQNRLALRSGSWNSGPTGLRAASRRHGSPDYRSGNVGFRLSRAAGANRILL